MEKSQKLDELLKWRYAHRGFHSKPTVPENSMIAFKRAVAEGFGIELDVHLTKDKKLAVIHDSGLRRTCGIDLNIEDITLQEAQVYFLEKSEEIIPAFEEVLGLVSGKVPLIIEIKSADGNHKELTDAVMYALEGYDGIYCIESFDPSVVGHLRKNYPAVVRGQLAGCLNKNFDKKNAGSSGSEPTLTGLQDFLLKNLWVNAMGRPDFVAYCYEDRDMRAFVNFRGAKFMLTIRSYDDLKSCEKSGASGIFEQFNLKDYE